MALILRNGGSQSPDRWLKEPRNNHLIRLSDIILLGGLEMRSDLKKIGEQKSTYLVGQTERALYLLDVISTITDRGNNAEVRRKKDGTLTVYEVKKNIVTV